MLHNTIFKKNGLPLSYYPLGTQMPTRDVLSELLETSRELVERVALDVCSDELVRNGGVLELKRMFTKDSDGVEVENNSYNSRKHRLRWDISVKIEATFTLNDGSVFKHRHREQQQLDGINFETASQHIPLSKQIVIEPVKAESLENLRSVESLLGALEFLSNLVGKLCIIACVSLV